MIAIQKAINRQTGFMYPYGHFCKELSNKEDVNRRAVESGQIGNLHEPDQVTKEATVQHEKAGGQHRQQHGKIVDLPELGERRYRHTELVVTFNNRQEMVFELGVLTKNSFIPDFRNRQNESLLIMG